MPSLAHPERPRGVSSDARWLASSALLLLNALGCNIVEGRPSSYAVRVQVEGDPGAPIASASVVRSGLPVASTGPDGVARIELEGLEGEVVPLNVRCPADYSSPGAPIRVVLRRNEDPSRLPAYRTSCRPNTRTLVVAVRATHGANLPVLHLGKEVARTDESGVAHAGLRVRPGERLELTLSTADDPRLIPQNPSAVFIAKDRDDLVFFEQSFKLPPPRQAVRRRPERL